MQASSALIDPAILVEGWGGREVSGKAEEEEKQNSWQ